jgi:hypothetical protein
MRQRGGDQEGLGKLRLNHLGRVALGGRAAELVGVAGGIRLDRH